MIKMSMTRDSSPAHFQKNKLSPTRQVSKSGQATNQPLVVSNDVARMTNYYKTKFEAKVEQMVQSSITSSQMSGRPMLTPLQEINR